MSIASVFAGLFGCVTRTDHDKKIAAMRAEIATLKNPLGDGEVERVLAEMEENRQAHLWWLERAEANPSDPVLQTAGDAEHQRWHVGRYDGFIACLARLGQAVQARRGTPVP